MENIMRYFTIGLLVLVLGLFTGCGSKISVKGKVTFPDKSPVTTGFVQFQTPTFTATGTIKPDGSYVIGDGKREFGGIPAGNYRVTVQAVGLSQVAESMEDVKPAQSLIDLKYNSPDKSGLTCDVKGSMEHDIVVEPFK